MHSASPSFPGLRKTCLVCCATNDREIERVLEGGADDGVILPCGKPFPECSNAACMRRRGDNDDLRLAQSLHFPSVFIHLLLGIHNRIGKEMNRRLRDSLVDQNFAVVFLLRRQNGCRISASRRHDFPVGSPILRAPSPFGRVSRLPRRGTACFRLELQLRPPKRVCPPAQATGRHCALQSPRPG